MPGKKDDARELFCRSRIEGVMTFLAPVQSQTDCEPIEMRRRERVQVRVPAWIVLMDYSEARSVTVTDISPDGASLAVGDWTFLPNTFHLLLQTSPEEPNFQIDCAIRWRSGGAVGVEFRQPLAGHVLADLVRGRAVTR